MRNTPFCNGLDEAILDQASLELLATCCWRPRKSARLSIT